MRLAALAVSMFALMTSAASAQDSADFGPWHRTLFISPMGEPFRATEPGQHGIDLWFAGADADHDGKMSRDEYMADATRFFSRLDANQDDSATSAESTALLERYAPEALGVIDNRPPIRDQPLGPQNDRHHRRDPDDPEIAEGGAHPSGPGQALGGISRPTVTRQGAGRFGLLDVIEPVMTCDTDFNRRITRDEFSACAARRFALIDANHDGFFTLDEAGARPRN